VRERRVSRGRKRDTNPTVAGKSSVRFDERRAAPEATYAVPAPQLDSAANKQPTGQLIPTNLEPQFQKETRPLALR
jgi:hypothetical protein